MAVCPRISLPLYYVGRLDLSRRYDWCRPTFFLYSHSVKIGIKWHLLVSNICLTL